MGKNNESQDAKLQRYRKMYTGVAGNMKIHGIAQILRPTHIWHFNGDWMQA